MLIIVSSDQSLPNNSEAIPRRQAKLTRKDQQKLKEQGFPTSCQNEVDLLKGKFRQDNVVEKIEVKRADSKNLLLRKDVIKDITQLLQCTKNDGGMALILIPTAIHYRQCMHVSIFGMSWMLCMMIAILSACNN